MKKTLICMILVALSGCRTRMPIDTTYIDITVPEIGTVRHAGVGDELLHQGVGTSIPAIVFQQDEKIGEIMVKKGKYVQTAKNPEYSTFANVPQTNIATGMTKKENIYLFSKDVGTKNTCISRKICANTNYSLEKSTTFEINHRQETLLYNGKVGNKVTFGYREFADGMARTAFSNEVTYDLSESMVIGYKGARIEIVKATNVEITYKVLAGFH